MPSSLTEKHLRVNRAYFSASIGEFLGKSDNEIVGELTLASAFPVESPQINAWVEQIHILKRSLTLFCDKGWVAFEFAVPRVGKRIDVLVIIRNIIFVLEFKNFETQFKAGDRDQVWDYALDLKNFHSTSHNEVVAPILIATLAKAGDQQLILEPHEDLVLQPINSTTDEITGTFEKVLQQFPGKSIDVQFWIGGRYQPTPTIIEAAKALYGDHSVEEISRSDAGAKNLLVTSTAIANIIKTSRDNSQKSICFVTGVPGAGKTLVGLDVATRFTEGGEGLHSVFLSGNGPLVMILKEALAREKALKSVELGKKVTLKDSRRTVQAFIQNIHHFRDEYLRDPGAPTDHVTIFDEAQRSWNFEQTTAFMDRKKGIKNFNRSESEFLISCMDRHKDWAVIVCLVGGGQEINVGEAGIGEWIRSVVGQFPDWTIYISPHLKDSEYAAGESLQLLAGHKHSKLDEDLHLAVSMRSFRAERLSGLVKQILDLELKQAFELHESIKDKYPIVLTRDLATAKSWLKTKARGSERYGMMVSSQAQRLKPLAIDVRVKPNPVHWFLSSKDDVRSSYYLEDVGTEFDVQGLELDWGCIVWDGDFRRSKAGWQHWSFKGNKWQRINKAERQAYLKNAYRVLLTRARQGMVIVVPEGDVEDPTRDPSYYSETFEYLKSVGLQVI